MHDICVARALCRKHSDGAVPIALVQQELHGC